MKIVRNFSKKIHITALVIALAITGGSLQPLHVSAGSSDIVFDNQSSTDSLNSSVWNVPSSGVIIEKGKIIFPEGSTEDCKVIGVSKIKNSQYIAELFDMDCNLVLNKIGDGQRFIIGLALDTADSYCEEAESIEIYFVNNNGIKVGVCAYDENGEAKTLVDAKNQGLSLGKSIDVSVNASNDMKLKIQVNGKTIYHDISPVNLEGRIGFLQTGSVEAAINTVEILTQKYDRPENTNLNEDFESGSIDGNRLYSELRTSSYAQCGASVEEIDGNKVFLFKNAGSAHLSTLHDFSNFECVFDIPYMQNKNVVDENGNTTQPKSSAFILAFGGIPCRKAHYAYTKATDAIVVEADKVYTLQSGQRANFDAKRYYAVEENVGPSVKLTVIDKMVSLSFKLLNSDEYEEILSYQIGTYTPQGQVQIWSNAWGNFAVDNLKITNKDQDANVIELEQKPFVMQGMEDWVYEPMKVVYKEVDDSKDGFNWNIALLASATLGVGIIVACVIATNVAKKQKEEKTHEI